MLEPLPRKTNCTLFRITNWLLPINMQTVIVYQNKHGDSPVANKIHGIPISYLSITISSYISSTVNNSSSASSLVFVLPLPLTLLFSSFSISLRSNPPFILLLLPCYLLFYFVFFFFTFFSSSAFWISSFSYYKY